MAIVLVIILTAVHLAIHIPAVQNYIAHTAVEKVGSKINGKIEFSKLTISFINRIVIKDFSITGGPGDTLASAEKVAVYISLADIIQGDIRANRIFINDGVFNFIEEGHKVSNLDRIFKTKHNPNDTSKGSWPHITIKELRIKNYRFNYAGIVPPKVPVHEGCMDYTHIGVSEINLRAYDVKTRPKKGITAKIHSLKAKEKCGLDLKHLGCDFSLDKNLLTMRNLRLYDNYSYVKANFLTFGYESGKDLKDFVRKIRLDADFTNTIFDFRTVGFYTDALQDKPLKLTLNGRVYGPVAHLQSQSLKVKNMSENTSIHLKFSMKGLPDIRKTIFDAKIFELHTASEDIDGIISAFTGNTKPIVSPILPKTTIALNLDMLGTIYDFKTKGDLISSIGDAGFDVAVKMQGKQDGTSIKGKVTTHEIKLGKILSSKALGEVTAGVKADLSLKGKEHGGMNVNIDSLKIDKFGFNGYNYKDIFAVGYYSDSGFDCRILGHDPNLHFKIQGVASTAKDSLKSGTYKLFADIPFADLSAINLLKDNEKGQLSLRTTSSVSTSGKNLTGSVEVNNLTYWGKKEYTFNSISLSALFQELDYRLHLDAPFINADYLSTEDPGNFVNRIKRLLLADHFGDTFTTISDTTKTSATTNIELVTYNTESVCDIVMPDLYISDSTKIFLNIDQNDLLDFHIDSDRLAFKENSLKDLHISLHNNDSSLVSKIYSNVIGIGSLNLNNANINIGVQDEIVDMECKFDNTSTDKSSLDLNTLISFERGDERALTTRISLDTSLITIKGNKWQFDPSEISIAKKFFAFENFKLHNTDQSITINGAISENSDDKVKVNLTEFDLSFLDSFVKKRLNIQGLLSGNVTASGIYDTPSILMDIKGNDISIMERTLGQLNILSKWDQNNSRMNILIQNQIEGMNPLTVSGYYQPNGKYLNANVALNELNLAMLEPFLQGILMNTGGAISGNIELVGTMDKLTLTSDNTLLHNFTFTPVYTKVPYVITGPIQMTRDAITLNNLTVRDKFNNEGTLNGSLRHRSFKNMYLDASLSLNNLQCLNTTEKDNQTFYGNAFASGSINLSGPFNDLFADITATTEPKTAIHIPLSSASSAKSEELLKFTSNETIILDPYLEKLKRNKKEKSDAGTKSNFSLQAKANVTSDAELFVEINKQLGDILKCKGNGTIDINVDPSKSLVDLKGDYTIDEGSYKFVLLGITAKDFIIDNGGSINFNGAVKNTSLNVGATYQTKASISTLISDTSAVGNRRTVNCGIKLSGSLDNPNVGFSIDVQDLDPITKGRVESALSTDDKIQKQFMALLISGSFVPDEQSGIVNNTTLLYSNAGEMLSNQFNNVFRQLDIPLDLGLNFQPASDGKTHDVFDVALSYQAFNNRVVINGNVGNSQVSQNWGGDFEAEVKLDQKGKMRLKAFTRSADDYSNYLDNTQRHGIGFTYQDEFDTFKELLRNIFWSKKRKEAYETKLMLDAEKQVMEEDKSNTQKKQIQQAKESPFNF